MAEAIWNGVCGAVGRFFFWVMIVPAGIIFLGWLVYIVVKIIKELRKP